MNRISFSFKLPSGALNSGFELGFNWNKVPFRDTMKRGL